MSALLKVKNHTSVSQQKVFWNNQTFPSLSRIVKLVMAIVTDLAIVTVLVIVTVLAVKAVRAIKPVMAIKTIMDIKTNMHLSGNKPGIECKELIPG